MSLGRTYLRVLEKRGLGTGSRIPGKILPLEVLQLHMQLRVAPKLSRPSTQHLVRSNICAADEP